MRAWVSYRYLDYIDDLEMDEISEFGVFKDNEKATLDPKTRKVTNDSPRYQKVRGLLVFAVNHDGRHKARLVAGGHLTPDPVESINSAVRLRYLRLAILLAKLNNMKVWGADIGNAYLEAVTKEKLYIVAGPEFEELEGTNLSSIRHCMVLSSGLRWAQRIHDIMLDMDFTPCKADLCVWIQKATCNSKYECVAIYVDSLLIACDSPEEIIQSLNNKFNCKKKGDGALEIPSWI